MTKNFQRTSTSIDNKRITKKNDQITSECRRERKRETFQRYNSEILFLEI